MTDRYHFPPSPRVACIGEAMIELSAIDLAAGRAEIGVAGDVYNTAVYLGRALARTGGSVGFVTVVGADPLSDAMVSAFAREGLETDLVLRHPSRRPGLYSIERDASGERSFSYWRSQSAARKLFSAQGPALTDLAPFDAVYLSAITLAILPDAVRQQVVSLCAALGDRGVPVVFDSNFRPQLWETTDAARDSIDAMWRTSAIALPSVDDERALSPGLTDRQIAARIQSLGPCEVILKRGAAGPLLLIDGQFADPGFDPARKVVDTTAAGDAFNAGYLAARAGGADPLAAARAGHDLACRVVGHTGAILPRDPGS